MVNCENDSVFKYEIIYNAKYALIVLVMVQILLGLIYLKTVPRFYNDEAWEASLGYGLANEGSLRHGIIEGWGNMHIYFVQNQVVMPFVLAAIYKIAGFGIVASRAGSVLMGVIAMVSSYFVMRRLFGAGQAFLIGVAVIMYPWFFEVSRRVRPEIYYIAIGMTSLLCLLSAIDTNSRVKAAVAGMLASLAGLTHPTGLVLVAVMFVAAVYWFEAGGLRLRLVLPIAIGFVIIVLPYVMYVLWAVQHPGVSFLEQMQGGSPFVKTPIRMLKSELVRWSTFLQWPKGIPYALILITACGLAFYKSGKAEKFTATVIILFALAMPFSTVNTTGRYLVALTPFIGALMICMIDRIIGLKKGMRFARLRWAAGVGIGCIYVIISVGAIMILLVRLHNADLERVIERIALVTGSKAKIYGEMLFWMGRGKINYGPYPLDYKWNQSLEMVERQNFDYAVRCAIAFSSSGGVKTPPQTMPPFGENTLDRVCRDYGKLVNSFRDPDFGPIEIYRLDLSQKQEPVPKSE